MMTVAWWAMMRWAYSRVQVRTSGQFSALTSWHDSPSWPWTCTRVLRSAFSFGSGHDIAVILRNVDRFFILKVSVIQSLLRCVPKKSFTFIQNEDISCRFFSKCWPDQNQNQEFNPSRCWAFCQIYKKKMPCWTKKLMTNFVLKVLKNEVPLFILVTSSVS